MSHPAVYRAPLRSRDDRVPAEETRRRALTLGVVGVGEAEDDRARARVERLRAVPLGSFVWTRAEEGYRLGRVVGEHRVDRSAGAVATDLVHVRSCEWLPVPVDPALVPEQVRYAFSRGGRNFQRIALPGADEVTARVWLQME